MSYRIVKTPALAVFLALSVLSVACSPTAPDPPPPPPPPPPPVEQTYTISGAVTEMIDGAPVPVEGVEVQESSTHQSTMTDAKGLYSIPGVKSTHTSVVAIKPGYFPVNSLLNGSADTRLDIRVVRIIYYTLSGMAYELTPDGRVPIPGIVLYCDGCGDPEGHTYVTTDADGLYSLAWAPSGITYLQIMGKDGYRYVGPASVSGGGGHGAGVPIPTVGDTRFDVEFVRR